MRTALFVILISVLTVTVSAQNKSAENPQYDSLLAKKLGADERGMKVYVMAFLKRGPNKSLSTDERKKLQAGHMQNIERMANEGKLIAAGPFMDDTELRGIYIFDVKTVEEAKELTMTDPAIQAGTLEMELHPWYGSAALLETTRIHNTLRKK